MAKSEAVKAIAHDAGISRKAAHATYDAIVDYVVRSVRRGEEVELPGVGTFSVTRKTTRNGRNPRTSVREADAEGGVVMFRPSRQRVDVLQLFVDTYSRL